MTPAITDSKFADLKAKLRELFELDKSDLDFGIYRIMAAKNTEVTAFLDRQLRDVVRQTLSEHGAGAAEQVQAELDKALQQAQALGADPEALPKVKELKAKLSAAAGASAAELEADIYNHLLAFFSRYYDEGDFISKRRYKGDVYAIPYSGEEVTLHWANKDQYYIKSGEWHKDYRFKLPGVGGKSIRFKLIEATQETNNNKEPDDAKRRYILAETASVEATDGELVLHFEFRVPTEAEKQRVSEGPITIFGGDYAKPKAPKKGDEREQFCADAEQRASAAMPASWSNVVAASAPTDTKPLRTILGKHLDYFTARNTFDYFIHKDLGGFLKRELDFYIKNEVVRLDDLEALPGDHLARVQGKVKAIRAVAGRIIDFLAAIENFQNKMWLKKKLVLETNWLVTIDRVPAALRIIVAANPKQWKEWEALGFKPDEGDEQLLSGPKWGSREYLDTNDKLLVDTGLFDPVFKSDLLSSDDLLAGQATFDEGMSGLLIHAENSAALRLLKARFAGQIQSTYIDPPYNTVHSKIAYKNQFEHASWLSLISNTFGELPSLWTNNFTFGLAIDDYEHNRLAMLLRTAFPALDHTTIVVNHHPQGSGGRISRTHEYYLLVSQPGAPSYLGRPLPDESEDRSFMRSGTAENNFRYGRPNSFYALLYDPKTRKFIGTEPSPDKDDSDYPTGPTCEGYRRIYPINSHGEERVWRSSYETGTVRIRNNELLLTKGGAVKYRIDHEDKREVLFSNWTGPDFNAGTNGTAVLDDLGLGGIFDYPKSVKTLEYGLWAQSFGCKDSYILDFFAGSGTTGHAVVNLNREGEEGLRRFILVEMGDYFGTMIKPRITKVLYSPHWKVGKVKTHGKGTSALIKYFALESYEDALNNLPAPTGELLAHADPATGDAMITYSLDLELGPSLLNLEAFRDPWGYTINAQPAGEAEIRPHRVDLVETFNYLLGLKVKAYGPIERYAADFERADHADNLGRLKVKGRLRRDPSGGFVFQRVEGELNDADGTRVLVVWRKLTALTPALSQGEREASALTPTLSPEEGGQAAEQDAAVLDAWMARHREETTERSEYREYQRIYINGPVTLPQPTAEMRTVWPTEQTFKDRMFADTDGGGA